LWLGLACEFSPDAIARLEPYVDSLVEGKAGRR
jgi:hypothetical protein